jgi:hypothetical protein
MTAWSRKSTLIAGTVLILAVNAAVLGGAAYNRSGTPDSLLRLSSRELELPYGHWGGKEENSGMAFALRWRVPSVDANYSDGWGRGSWEARNSPAWLDEAKLEELGFDVAWLKTSAVLEMPYYARRVTKEKEVLLVLELDGPTFRQAIEQARQQVVHQEALYAAHPDDKKLEQQAKSAKERLTQEERLNSRLFLVDAGLDEEKLRARYPDRTRHAIAQGRIQPFRIEKGRLSGHLLDLSVSRITVPLAFRPAFERTRQKGPDNPTLEIELAYGKRLEPWIMAVSEESGPK